jgi:hypothetical protein
MKNRTRLALLHLRDEVAAVAVLLSAEAGAITGNNLPSGDSRSL